MLVLTTVDSGREALEVWRTDRREPMLVTYSSFAQLVESCGSGQPWIEIASDRLVAICRSEGILLVAIDMALPMEPRYPEADPATGPDLQPLQPVPAPDGHAYLPSRPTRPGQRSVELELRKYGTQTIAPVYTSPELLHGGCGPYQPWVSVRTEDLTGVVRQAGADGVLLNPQLDENLRYQAPARTNARW